MKSCVALLGIIACYITIAAGEENTSSEHSRRCGALAGMVRDVDSHEPVAGTQLLILELNRAGASHEDGRFFLPGLPLGLYTLQTFRIGYQTAFQQFRIAVCDTNRIEVMIKNSPLQMRSVFITDSADQLDFARAAKPLQMEGKKLRQQLGRTIAETIADEPGLDQRSMGPSPARPVLRGLGGDRLLILEDGERTGDLSATSADHAVVVEPMTADRIEVIRGPGTLKYGPNSLGGVINVNRGYVPTTWLDHVHGTATYQGETANQGQSGGLALTTPMGPFSARFDASHRQANDVKTPIGTLANTAITTRNGSAGLSLVRRWGYIGMAGAYYRSEYGIPGGFVGAHPKGVDIDLERKHYEIKSSLIFGNALIKQVDFSGTYSRYFHQEFESNGSLGIEFGLLTYNGSLSAKLADRGLFQSGQIGLWSEYRNYASGGFSFSPPTEERTLAGYYYQEAMLGKWHLKSSVRFDARTVSPEHEKESYRIGHIQQRAFSGFSGGLATHYHLSPQLYTGATVMRSFRAPAIEELFSEGPHLAAYSFEVGNPKLARETGLGLEFYLQWQWRRGGLELSVFRNDLSNYIFPKNTGQLNYRTLLPTYRFSGLDAVMRGGEASFEYEFLKNFALTGSMSYVRGDLHDLARPLPWMPPLSGKLDLRYNRDKHSFGGRMRAAAKQTRVGEFEQGTDGYAVFDLFAQYVSTLGHFLTTVDLNFSNLTDSEYRRHLSRVKDIMPEPGRNVKLLCRVYF